MLPPTSAYQLTYKIGIRVENVLIGDNTPNELNTEIDKTSAGINKNEDRLIIALDGNDLVSAGNGNDYIFGGEGIDTVSYESIRVLGGPKLPTEEPDELIINLNQQKAQLHEAPKLHNKNFQDNLVDIENVIGSPVNDFITGTDDNNELKGLGGDDLLNWIVIIIGGKKW